MYSVYASMQQLTRRQVFTSSVAGQAIHTQVAERRLSLNLKMKNGPLLEIWINLDMSMVLLQRVLWAWSSGVLLPIHSRKFWKWKLS